MKRAVFILGLIAGVLGVMGCGLLFFKELFLLINLKGSVIVFIIAAVALLLQIAGLFMTCIRVKVVSGIIMIIAGISDIVAALASISAKSLISFIFCSAAAILFIIAGIMACVPEKQIK